MNRGLILEPIKPEKDYIFGAAKDLSLGGDILVPSGDWSPWLPADELQNHNFEPSACVTFGTLNCVETLERFEYGKVENYSDRWLAFVSGTTQAGNSPQKVAETLRKKGDVREDMWPYPVDATWPIYYQQPPQSLYSKALVFIAEFEFGHEYVPPTTIAMMDALKYSPLGVSVYAWDAPDMDGIYHRPGDIASNHWCMCYGFVANHYWLVLDSYDNTRKKLAWNFGFEQVKRYTLHRQIVNETFWQQFLKWLGF
jgi:hypothetical protein